MDTRASADVTILLNRISGGDAAAARELFGWLYQDLPGQSPDGAARE